MRHKLLMLVSQILDISLTEVSDSTSLEALRNWTVSKQLRLAMAVEEEFQVRFSDEELHELRSVQQILNVLATRTAAQSSEHGRVCAKEPSSRGEIIRALDTMFRDIFKGELGFDEKVARKDYHVWDSLNHMALMVSLEQRFSLELNMKAVLKLQDGKSILDFILEKYGFGQS